MQVIYQRISFLVLLVIFINNLFAVTLDEMIGQMLIVGFDGTELQNSKQLQSDLKNKRIGGVVLFDIDKSKLLKDAKKYKISVQYFRKLLKSDPKKRAEYDLNIISPTQVLKLTNELQKASQKHMNLPLLIAIDREGGLVNRLSSKKGFPKTISQKEFATKSEKEARRIAKKYAKTLKKYRINYVFAPVVDLEINKNNPVIALVDRAFSHDPKIVVKNATYMIDAYKKLHIACTLKHFPGHGSSTDDSHFGLVDVTKTWQTKELEPFRNLIMRNNTIGLTVMTAHIVNKKLDHSGLPATFSKEMLNILRKDFGYDGILISDDLQMKAITNHYDLKKTLKLSILGGNDLLLLTKPSDEGDSIAKQSIDIIKKLIKEKVITKERIEKSYKKIIKLKEWIA